MTGVKVSGALGFVGKFIKFVFGLVLKVLSFFNLEYAALVVLVGLVMWLTGAFEVLPWLFALFAALAVISVAFGIYKTFSSDKKPKEKKDERGYVEMNANGATPQDTSRPSASPATGLPEHDERAYRDREGARTATSTGLPVYPRYYAVRQNPAYVMAEYEDKFVLYRKVSGGLRYVRTDKK